MKACAVGPWEASTWLLRAYRRAWRASAGNLRIEVKAIDVPVRTFALLLEARAGGARYAWELRYRDTAHAPEVVAAALDVAAEAMQSAVERGLT